MNTFRCLLLIFVLMFSSHLADAAEASLSPDQMRENMQFIMKTLLGRHPNPYHLFPKDKFEKKYSEVMAQIKEPRSPMEFYFLANQIVMLLKDAHTKLIYNYDEDEDVLPMKLVYLEDGIGILKSPLHPELQNTRIISLDGITPDVWLDRIASIRTHESEAFIRWKTEKFLLFQYVHAYFSKKPDIASVSIIADRNGEIIRVSVPFISEGERKKIFEEESNFNDKFFSYSFNEKLSAGYFEMSACEDTAEYRSAVDVFMKRVKGGGIRNLILDLRKNHGGVSSVLYALLKHFPGNKFLWGDFIKIIDGMKQPLKYKDIKLEISETMKDMEPFTGNVYVLISQYTFSSGNEVAIVFRDNKLGTLIGQKTSNAPCCFGASSAYELPHGKFTLSVSSNYWTTPKGDCGEDGVMPDIEIPLTLQDIFENRDPVIEWLEKNLEHN